MPTFRLFAVPATFWDDRPRASPPTDDELLREQLREAKALRERIERGVNLESERGRFTDILNRIEATLLRRSVEWPDSVRTEWDETQLRTEIALMRFPALELGEEYLHLLSWLEALRLESRTPGITEPANPLDLGGSIYRAEQLDDHLEAAAAEIAGRSAVRPLPEKIRTAADARAAFYARVKSIGQLGVIEVQLVQDNGTLTEAPGVRSSASRVPENTPQDPDAVAPPQMDFDAELAPDKPKRKDMVNRLHAEVAAAVEQYAKDGRGGKVNASNQPHEVSTDVFGEWARASGEPARVRIVYADASEAAPFPLRCLAGRARPAGEPRVIKAALMSMRHLDIDRMVDLAWYRNREVSQTRSLAESDEFCFRYSLGQLRELAKLKNDLGAPIRLEIFHTGFEPASVGLYRAVAAVLSGDASFQAEWAAGLEPWLIVAPHYFKGGTTYEPSRDREGNVIEWF